MPRTKDTPAAEPKPPPVPTTTVQVSTETRELLADVQARMILQGRRYRTLDAVIGELIRYWKASNASEQG